MGTKHLRTAQKAAPEPLVDLFTLDISRYGGPVLRWTPGPLGAASKNQVVNTSFKADTSGWSVSGTTGAGPASAYGAAYWLADQGSGYFKLDGALSGVLTIRTLFVDEPVEAGQWWEAQARLVPIRCRARVEIAYFNAANAGFGAISSSIIENAGAPASANRLEDYTLLHIRAKAPAGAAKIRMTIRMDTATGGSTDPAIIFTMAQLCRVQGEGSGQPQPFSQPRAAGTPSSVVFSGVTFTPFPLLIEGMSWTTRGAMPRPKVTIPDIDSYFTSLLAGYQDLLGCPITRLRVFADNLDGGRDPDPTSYFGPEVWLVDRVARQDPGEEVVIELANPLDLQGKMLPGRQVIRDTCTHIYRYMNGSFFVPGTCPYAGISYFKADGSVTAVPAEDACGKRLKDCKLRFPNQPLPTRAFPGVGKYRT
jgi:lambda family phage minor tail protein L